MEIKKIFKTSERLQYGYYQFMDHFFTRERVFRWHYKSRRKLYANLHQRLKEKGEEGKLVPIDRRKDLSIDEFKREYINKGLPVVLEGAANDWACVKNWSLDYFKELYGEEEILLVDHEAIESEYEKLKLAEVLDGIREGKGKYYRFYPLLQRHPEHIKDFDYEWILKSRHKMTYGENFQVFIGGAGTATPLHNAFSCNIFTQVYGEKKWVLYPPYYSMVLDPDPANNIYRNASYRNGGVFDPFNPTYEKHPLYKYINGMTVHLKPGDVFYNPPYWWHAVSNPTDSIGVGYRWLPPLHCYRMSPLYFFLDLCAVNPSLWKAMRLAKTDINLIQLAQTDRLDDFLKAEADKKHSRYKTV